MNRTIETKNGIHTLTVNGKFAYESEFLDKVNARWRDIKESHKTAVKVKRNDRAKLAEHLGLERSYFYLLLNPKFPKRILSKGMIIEIEEWLKSELCKKN